MVLLIFCAIVILVVADDAIVLSVVCFSNCCFIGYCCGHCH